MNYIPSVLQPIRGFLSIPSNPSKTPHKTCLFRLYRRVIIQPFASETNIIQGCLVMLIFSFFSQTRKNNSKLNITSRSTRSSSTPGSIRRWNTIVKVTLENSLFIKKFRMEKKVIYPALIQGHYFKSKSFMSDQHLLGWSAKYWRKHNLFANSVHNWNSKVI